MEKNSFFILIVVVFVANIQMSSSATLKFNSDSNIAALRYRLDTETSSEGDLVYSDVSSKHQEARERLYRQLRQYGVPSDVAQMYVPRGMTVGELLGKGTSKPHHSSAADSDDEESNSTFDPWSIVWYIGSFGGLIAFFLVISCSEWCCLRSRSAATLAAATGGTPPPSGRSRSPRCPLNSARGAQPSALSCETPPPGYHLFAPPSYDDTVIFGEKGEIKEKRKFDVFVVPVHSVPEVRGGCLENSPPPQYAEINLNPI